MAHAKKAKLYGPGKIRNDNSIYSGGKTMTAEAAALILAVLAGLILAYPLGYLAGVSRGKALGWQDGYFKRIADDRSKRGADGRFKAKGSVRNAEACNAGTKTEKSK
jgi:hypothetical protein